ncbi:MAG: class I SAM-dependent RNA methyltransferase [Candidatus Spyradenecus sp.]
MSRLTLHIDDVGYGGDGVARAASPVTFVPGAFTGEIVEAEVVQRKPNFARARLLRVLDPSPDRITPEGPVVPGMVYAALAYPAEVALKHHQLQTLLTRIGRLDDLSCLRAPVPSPLAAHYRNKLTLHWDGRALGYIGEDNRTVQDTPACPLSHPAINAALAQLRADSKRLRALRPGSRVTFRYTARDGIRLGLGKPPAGELTETLAGLTLSVAADAFFQVNPAAAELLLADFRAAVAALAPRRALDLYCGCGLFGLAATQAGVRSLFGLETTPSAVRSAQRNAARAGVEADYRCAPAESLPEGLPPAELWIVDPPRDGLSSAVRDHLLRARPPHLAYISCGPDTLARDLRALAPAYRPTSIRLFDFFPRTAHFETFTLLARI